MKNHALRRIAFISVLLIFFTDIIVAVILTFYSNSIVTDSCRRKAEDFRKAFYDGFLNLTIQIMDGSEDIEGDPVNYQFVTDYLKGMFAFSEAKYTYVFYASHEKEEIEYLFVIAADDEVDRELSGDRKRGVSVKPDNHSFIDRALDGELAGPERVNNKYGDVLTYYFPVYSKEGEVLAVAGLDFDVSVNRTKTLAYVSQILTIVSVVLITVLGLLLLVLRRKVFRPIKEISMQMNSFDPEKEHTSLTLNTYLEIEEINGSFDKMSEEIIGYIKNLRTMTEERSRSAAELNIARSIQMGMVPERLALSGEGFELCASASPAKEVGGDFYDCFELDERVYIVIADVSGKGIAAALFMAMVRNMIREKLRAGASPAEALNSANDEICAENPEGMFVTVFAAVFDPFTGELVYANGGHTNPIVLNASGGRSFLPLDPGIVLGLFEDAGLENGSMILESGSVFAVYTDGVTEALNADRELFGEKRLLESAKAGSAEQTAASIAQAVKDHSDGCEQSDDITLVTLRFDAGEGYTDKILAPEMKSLGIMRESLFGIVGNDPVSRKIALACEEILVNIINYSGTDSIRMTIGRRGGELAVRFEDHGKAFDPIKERPDEKDFSEYDTGGLGISLVLQLARKTRYLRIGGSNMIGMIFALN